MLRLRQMLKTTAVRLTLIYTVLFGLLAVGVVAYISYNTSRLILSQVQSAIDEEVLQIAGIARSSSLRSLIPMIERRSRRPGANLYLVSDATGRIIAGNVKNINRDLLIEDGWLNLPFNYLRFGEGNEEGQATAKVFSLPGGLRLLVGRDIVDAERFRDIVFRASTVSLAIMMLTGLFLWFFVGRRALRHIDSVSQSSQRIMAGDLTQRLPISGSGDEFDRLSAALNDIISRVEKLNSGITTVSDDIAHDLKTPLTRLRNRAEASLLTGNYDETIPQIISDADGLIKTFDAVLMISQVESGAKAIQFNKVDLTSVVENIHELFEPTADEQGVQLVVDIADHLSIECSEELISQAITNLLDNALKYGSTADQPRIEMGIRKLRRMAIIVVSDNGEGIPEADHDTVTERFARLDTSRTKPGTGLGLALVKATVKLHDGELVLKDYNPGLIVEIHLPLAR